MAHNPDEDIEIVLLGDGKGDIVLGNFGYYEVFESDLETVVEGGKIVAISLNTLKFLFGLCTQLVRSSRK